MNVNLTNEKGTKTFTVENLPTTNPSAIVYQNTVISTTYSYGMYNGSLTSTEFKYGLIEGLSKNSKTFDSDNLDKVIIDNQGTRNNAWFYTNNSYNIFSFDEYFSYSSSVGMGNVNMILCYVPKE